MSLNDDLDNYKTGGTYTSSQSSITNSIVHKPVSTSSYAIYLIVLQPYDNNDNTVIHQIAIMTNGIFHRYYTNVSNTERWTDWNKIAFES